MFSTLMRTIHAGGRVTIALLLAGSLLALFPDPAPAQENTEQLQRKYDDALNQLNAAQKRKNELTEENDKLKQTVEDLKKQLGSANNQVADLKRDQAEQADRTFYLRSHYAAWEAFLRQYPELMGRWKAFMESDFYTPRRDLPPITTDERLTTETGNG